MKTVPYSPEAFDASFKPTRVFGRLKDPHERECAGAAIAARLEKAKGKGRKEWLAFRKAMLGC